MSNFWGYLNRKIVARVFVFSILIGSLLFIFRDPLLNLYQTLINKLPGNALEQISEITKSPTKSPVNEGAEGSGPLIATKESPKSFLTVDGVIKFTNLNRTQNGLAALNVNAKLNQSALVKAQDMFARQYFEHESPDGKGAGDLAEAAGYRYIVIGENLATGNFLNDRELVQGWMDSPGHRANILNKDYKDIGVAVLKGVYQGRSTWMAVQHFGRPLSDCPSPSSSLKSQIDQNESTLSAMSADLTARKAELEGMNKNDPSYNQKVEEYNNLVNQYNALVEKTKAMINDYNSQVNAFNACAA